MASEAFKRDVNYVPVIGGVTDDTNKELKQLRLDSTNYRVLVDGEFVDVSQLVPKEYDYIALSYSGDNISQVLYRSGGVAGGIVATLTLSYTGSSLMAIART